METIAVAAVTLLGFTCGWQFTTYLTTVPLRMSRALTLTLVLLFSVIGVLVLAISSGPARWIGIAFALTAAVVGYLLNARRVLGREDDRDVPKLLRAADDPGQGHTAVVYFTHGEPETYDPIGWLNQFREFDEQGIAFVPFFARPFFLKALRDAYLRVGMSQHRHRHMAMASDVEQWLHARGHGDVRVYVSFLDDDPRPDAAVIQALNDGASRIVVSEVFVSISNHTAEGEDLIKELDIDDLGVPIDYTGPLWDSPTLHRMFVDKVEQARGDVPRDEVAVLLVGHGQPDEWDREWPTETEHELQLRHSIIDALVDAGYRRDLLDLAWMEFKSPKVPERAQDMATRGAKRFMYFSAGISAESLHSQYDVPKLVEKADLGPAVQPINLGAWNDHPLTIQAIGERVEALLPVSVVDTAGSVEQAS